MDEQILPNGGEVVEQDRVDLLTDVLRRWVGNPTRLAEHGLALGGGRKSCSTFAGLPINSGMSTTR